MKSKCIIPFLAGILLLAGQALPANAASNQDGEYQTTSSLHILSYAPNLECASTDLSDVGQLEALATSVDATFASKTSWAASQVTNMGLEYVIVVWSVNDPGQVYFSDSNGSADSVTFEASPYPATNLHYVAIFPKRGYVGFGDCSAYPVPTESMSRISTRDGSFKNYFVSDAQIHYPADYGGKRISALASATYVAMGDSFSSGEGNPPFIEGTNTNDDKCHRSKKAYPHLLKKDKSLRLGKMAFVACSGATTADVLNGKFSEPPQVNALSSTTKVVTITIGGNDIKFGDLASACVYGSCTTSSEAYQESWGIMTDLTRSDYLPNRLESVFTDIANHLYINPNAKVYVIGYPYVMTRASWEKRGLGICSDFDGAEATAVENIVSELNTVLQSAVTKFGDSRFVYVNPLRPRSPFLGHELCRRGAYFSGTDAGVPPNGAPSYVFHPNKKGQQAYARLVKSSMNQ